MKIIALISTYQESDNMLNSAIESASMLDETFVFEGTTKGMKNLVEDVHGWKSSPNNHPYVLYSGHWKSDADKRTEMLMEAKASDEDAWAIWIDGDEILLYGQYLKDHCYRADEETATGGTTIRIVEYDGSVAKCYGKLIRVSAITRYIMSSYEVELSNGMTVAMPNVPICSAGGIPIGEITERDSPLLALNRPPLIGEPHLLHRHGLRSPEREAPRLHEEEAKDIGRLVREGN